ncbi:MAG: DUF192 domain-containing protein [Bacteroidales bacterium]|nr:DUF192 domain-containing protein [Bacteroidales bacterium]
MITKKNFRSRREPQPKRMMMIMLLFLIPLAFLLVFAIEILNPTNADVSESIRQVPNEIQFRVDGQLSFYTAGGDSITTISIEIAETPQSREKGLMFRYLVPDTMGMLFIYHEEQYQGYWMKNTHVPLDILYANKDFGIVSIYENTKPESEEILPSGDKAKYVIEVAGGFVKKHGIKRGDKFSFQSFSEKD